MKLLVPDPVGVPLRTPVAELRLSPVGGTPLMMLHVIGVVPLAVNMNEYGESCVPPGSAPGLAGFVIVGGVPGS